MNVIVDFFNQIIPILQAILLLGALIGGAIAGVSVFKSSKRSGLVKIQDETIVGMQQQINMLKEQNAQQQEKIDHLEFESKAMRDALKDEGILITVDGERITIKNMQEPDTTKHIIRKPTRKPTTPVVKKDEV